MGSGQSSHKKPSPPPYIVSELHTANRKLGVAEKWLQRHISENAVEPAPELLGLIEAIKAQAVSHTEDLNPEWFRVILFRKNDGLDKFFAFVVYRYAVAVNNGDQFFRTHEEALDDMLHHVTHNWATSRRVQRRFRKRKT